MKCAEIPPGGRYGDITGMDTRADWLLGPALDDYLPDAENMLIPFIMTLYDKTDLESVRRTLHNPPFFISSIYARGMQTGKSFSAFAPKSFFDELRDKHGRYADLHAARKEIKLCLPIRSSQPEWTPGEPAPALDVPPMQPPEGGWPGDTVVIGVIDDGIAFAHDRFRDAEDTSRVQCFWRQDGPNNSTTVDHGTEICKLDGPGGQAGIDTLLAQSRAGGSIDEETFYRRAGLIDFAEPGHKSAAWRASHGTHVLDLAAGENPAENVCNRPIVCVQLPPAVVEDPSLAGLEDKVLSAIDYILLRADAMAGDGDPLPVVINFSFGNIAGPHDGTSILERGIDERIQARQAGLRVILPSGNSHLSRCHAQVSFSNHDGNDSEPVELYWRVQPDDTTTSHMEIWLPHHGPAPPATSRLEVSVRSPDGVEETTWLGENHGAGHQLPEQGPKFCGVEYRFKPSPTERGVFSIHLQPTARLHPTALADKVAPPGLWTIRLRNRGLAETDVVHAWIQRDDKVYSYPRRGRQSYFDQPCYVRFDTQGREIVEDSHPEQPPCEVKRRRLVNAIATGAEVIVAGGFHRRDLRPAKYSAGGPITPPPGGAPDPDRRKPDAMLVADDSKVHAGVLAAGSRSGSVVAFSGTSVAAPRLARWVASELGAGNAGNRDAVKAEAAMQEAGRPNVEHPLPDERGGWGRMELPPPPRRRGV